MSEGERDSKTTRIALLMLGVTLWGLLILARLNTNPLNNSPHKGNKTVAPFLRRAELFMTVT